jgi:LysM repeat protein
VKFFIENTQKFTIMNRTLLLAIIACFFANTIQASSLDSLRIDTTTGKNVVLHKADRGQTLYALLRRYQSSMAEFKALNPGEDVNLQLGKVYKIAYNKAIIAKASPKASPKEQVADKRPKPAATAIANEFFKVTPGMTLFAVSRKTGVPVAEIKRLNNLKTDQIEIGQMLRISEAAQHTGAVAEQPTSKPSTEKKYETPSERIVIVKENTKTAEKPNEVVKPEVKKEEPVAKTKETVDKNSTMVSTKAVEPEKKVVEAPKNLDDKPKTNEEINKAIPTTATVEATGTAKTDEGVAEVIELESKSGKYLALHKTAPIGTLLQVRNETNGATVWVKVIGRLPELSQNENIVVKLSPKAMSRVSPIDKRFRAKVFYTL